MVVKSLINKLRKIVKSFKGPSHLAGVSILVTQHLLTSCTTVRLPILKKQIEISKSKGPGVDNKDYVDHLKSLKETFLNTPNVHFYKNNFVQKYLGSLLDKIILKNEIFFAELKKAEIIIINQSEPIHFSLPGGIIFLSSGLITRYIKNEGMLSGLLSFELVKSEKLLYPKNITVPTGFISVERILSLLRLGIEEKMEVHKWAFYMTRRAGFDGEYYLNWLQTQNRNTADFILQVGDINQLNREEALFKDFLIKNIKDEQGLRVESSSKNFYTFLNLIRNDIK